MSQCGGFTKTHQPCKYKPQSNGYCQRHQCLVKTRETDTYLALLPGDIIRMVYAYLYRNNTVFAKELLFTDNGNEARFSPYGRYKSRQRLMNEISVRHSLGLTLVGPVTETKHYKSGNEEKSYQVVSLKFDGTLLSVSEDALVDLLSLFVSNPSNLNALLIKHKLDYRIVPVYDETIGRLTKYDIVKVKVLRTVDK